MKKYLRLVCNVCNRQVDKLVDNTRVTPDKCTITLNCLGRLFPIEYRSDAQITTSVESGVVDWYPRGTTLTTAGVQEAALVDTSTGSLQQLVLAVKLPADPGNVHATVTLNARSDRPKEFKQYTFRREATFTTISGIEDGAEKKLLKFTAWGPDPDIVEVYLNGEKLEIGTDPENFQVDDGTPSTPAPSNTISFNSIISPVGVYPVDVIVSKAAAVPGINLVFERNQDDPNRLSLGAWENVSAIQFFEGAWENYYLFTCDIASTIALTKDSIVYPVGTILVDSTVVGLDAAKFLLAKKPFTQIDRYTNLSVPLDTLGADRDYLKYHSVDGVLTLEVTETSIESNFPVGKLIKFNPETTIKTPVEGDEAIELDGTTVVGPDR